VGTRPERPAIRPYGRKFGRLVEGPRWWRGALAVAAYFLVLWLVAIPGYPVPEVVKATVGFLLAGASAGIVVRRRGWLAGLIGYAAVVLLVVLAVVVTLGTSFLGPAFLVNGSTAGGDTATVGKAGARLAFVLAGLALGGAILSAAGGAAGTALRHRNEPTARQ